jgi:hypothetical protein
MSSNKELLSQEYEGLLESIKLIDYKNNSHDIRDQHTQLVYIESIPNQAIAGHAFLVDTIDFPTLLPMIGEEKLSASFTRAEPAKNSNTYLGGKLPALSFEYPIFKLEGKNPDGGSRKRQTYTLHYCSQLPFINLNNVVYRTFKNMKYSDMVKKIFDEFIKTDGPNSKPLIIEETKNSGDLQLSGVTPLSAIRRIASRSISSEDNGFLYVFFEGRDAYYFTTLQKLMKQTPKITLRCELKNVSKDSSGSFLKDRDLDRQVYNVDNYRRENIFDVLGSALLGEGSSSLWTIDPLIRRHYYNEFDLRGKDKTGDEYWKKFPHLGDKKPWTGTNKMFIKPRPNMSYMVTDYETSTDEYFSSKSYEQPTNMPEDHYLHKMSMITQLDRNTITTTITGDPRVKVGDVVQFNIPEMLGVTGADRPEMKDAWVQGNYLVLAVAHHFTNDKYKMTMKLVRDGFHTDIYNRDPKDYAAFSKKA